MNFKMGANGMDDIIYRLIDFAEENWSSFLQRCEESGIDEEEAEKLIEELKAKNERWRKI